MAQSLKTFDLTGSSQLKNSSTAVEKGFAVEMRCREFLRLRVEIDENILRHQRVENEFHRQRVQLNVEPIEFGMS